MSVHFALLCPVDPAHGRLLDAPAATHGFFCPHAAHGGNGRYFTTAEAEAPASSARLDLDAPHGRRRGVESSGSRPSDSGRPTGAVLSPGAAPDTTSGLGLVMPASRSVQQPASPTPPTGLPSGSAVARPSTQARASSD